ESGPRREGEGRGAAGAAERDVAGARLPGPRRDPLAEQARDHVGGEGDPELVRIARASPAEGDHAHVAVRAGGAAAATPLAARAPELEAPAVPPGGSGRRLLLDRAREQDHERLVLARLAAADAAPAPLQERPQPEPDGTRPRPPGPEAGVENLARGAGRVADRTVHLRPSAAVVEPADEKRSIHVVEDRLRVDRERRRPRGDHASKPLQALDDGHAVAEEAVAVAVLEQRRRPLDQRAPDGDGLAGPGQGREVETEALALERVGQLVRQRVDELGVGGD